MSHLPKFGRSDSRVNGTWTALPDSNPQHSNGYSPSRRFPDIRIPSEYNTAENDRTFDATSTNAGRTLDGTIGSTRHDELIQEHNNGIVSKQSKEGWRPYSLRPVFLGSMAAISMAFSITLAVLCWYSVKNHGLREDADTPGSLIVRRYLPTILAVFFTQAMVIISNDIKRTEPFARLARSDNFDVEHTLLYTPKAWWSTFREGLMRKRNSDQVNWVLVLSSLATGISILALSTLSSSLLVAEQVALRSDVDLHRFNPFPLTLEPRRQAYFHTTSAFLFNASTSMWVSDDYVVSPFGTIEMYKHPDFLPEGTWEMETKVLQTDLKCSTMDFGEFVAFNSTRVTEVYDPPGANLGQNSASSEIFRNGFVNQTYREPLQGFTLDSNDGCHIQLLSEIATRGEHRISRNGGLYWTNLSSSYITYDDWAKGRGQPIFSRAREWSPQDAGLLFDFSDACIGRSLIIVTTPWAAPRGRSFKREGFKVRAELCTPQYFEAIVNVTASVTASERKISLDKERLLNRRSKIPKDLMDLEKLQQLTFGRERLDYLNLALTLSPNLAYEGWSEILASLYSASIEDMLENSTLPTEAARLNSRFFGELVFSAMTQQQPVTLKSTPAQETQSERRLLIVTETAATLSALLLIFSCYLLFLFTLESSRRRPLCLKSDPATVFAAGALLQKLPHLHQSLNDLRTRSSHIGRMDTTEAIEYAGYQSDKVFPVKGYTAMNATKKVSNRTWKPKSLRTWSMTALTFALCLIATALLTLQHFASRQMLWRSAFVYQLDLRVFNARFSPQSVLATLLAVGVSMWWDAMDKVLRTLQPYLSMSDASVDVRYGAALSYQASYWLWASTRAAINSHWLLSLVTFGTTLCQILIVSIAAIFERGPGLATTVTHLNHTLMARQLPLVYNHTVDPSYMFTGLKENAAQTSFLQDIMRITTSDWMYSALDQITLGTEQPDWSRDGWSFTPVNFQALPTTRNYSAPAISKPKDNASSLLASTANVTLTTSALRARLQCSSVETKYPSWFVTNEVDLFSEFYPKNSTAAKDIVNRLNRTGYILPHTIFNGTTHETSVFSRTSAIQCCSNETDAEGRAAVGYWSQLNTTAWWGFDASLGNSAWVDYGPAEWPPNFAVKWIVGPTTTSNVTVYTNGAASEYKILQFKEVPPMAFLDCKPIIEEADAQVVLAHGEGRILDYNIVAEPRTLVEPWTAHFRHANESNFNDTIATVSYGSYFLTQLLGASSIAPLPVSPGFYPPFDFENLEDDRFNIRDAGKGYNMDFMSYANLYQVNMDPNILLDAEVLMNYTQRTFQTFFQHFASQTKWLDGQLMAYESMSGDASKPIEVTLTQRIETMTMVPSATWLSLAIILILIIILAILIVVLKVVYPHETLRNNIECLADVLALIQGSDGLLWFAERHDIKTLKESGMSTKLGWFKDRTGMVRWGIELVDAPGIEWIDEPRAFEMDRMQQSSMHSRSQSTDGAATIR